MYRPAVPQFTNRGKPLPRKMSEQPQSCYACTSGQVSKKNISGIKAAYAIPFVDCTATTYRSKLTVFRNQII